LVKKLNIKNKQTGFTLIELMITLVVAVVLLTISIPSFRTLMANNRATTQANALYSALNYARAEAIGRGTTVTVCPKSTPSVSSTTCGSSADWANGWQVFTDDNANGVFNGSAVPPEIVLKNWEPLPGTPTLVTTAASMIFDRDGSKTPVSQGDVTVAMSEANTSGAASRCVRATVIGMVRVHKITATATCP
jgi:type IV fimbrial biogenesis protein FimT